MAKVPEPKYDRDAARLVSYYKRAFRETAAQLKTIKFGIERQHAESLLNQIAFILKQLDEDTKKWCQETITQNFKEGQARTLVSIGEASSLAEAASLASFSLLARDSIEALVNDTYSDLLIATKNTETKIKQLVRSVVSDTMRVRAIEQLGRKTQRNDIAGKLARQGLSKNLDSEGWVGIVDSAGRRWNLSTYAEMVVRTKMQQAHIEGVRVEALERKVDLAVISSHGATDSCANFEGMVISLNGTTPGYPTYAELRATNKIFHPNCQHSVNTLSTLCQHSVNTLSTLCKHSVNPVRTLSLLPKDVRDKHFEKLAGMEKVLGKKFEPQAVLTPGAAAAVRPKAQKWTAAKTVEEAEQHMSELYPHIRWDFKGTHVDVMNPTLKEFDRLAI